MNLRSSLIIAGAACALFVSGCSTTETRIQKNLPAFNQATPSQQEMIKQGKVGLGFHPELVKLAMGEPDRIRSKLDEKGEFIIWVYNTWESDSGVMLYTGHYHRWYSPRMYFADYPRWDRREREAVRVTFSDGKVISVETEN